MSMSGDDEEFADAEDDTFNAPSSSCVVAKLAGESGGEGECPGRSSTWSQGPACEEEEEEEHSKSGGYHFNSAKVSATVESKEPQSVK